MISLDLQRIASIIKSTTTDKFTKVVATGISTDTRTLKKGDLFFALKGPKYDGHEFVSKAKALGAVGAVIDEIRSIDLKKFALLQVHSPIKALGDLAKWYKSQFKTPTVGITGSAGKTTTKDLLSSILSKSKNVLSTEGNLNNYIGLPQMIFRLNREYDFAVFELGMNRAGEILRLTQIANPQIGIITNIGHAHLEFLETIEKVAEAKYELWKAMDNKGVAIVNLDDEHITKLARRWSGEKITFSTSLDHADVLINLVEIGVKGKTDCELLIRNEGAIKLSLPLIGPHNLYNAAAAAAGALALKVSMEDIAEGLKSPNLTPMRSEILYFHPNRVIYNDAYNANPDAMEAALQCLSMMKGERKTVAILGDMLELGPPAKDFHFDIGSLIGELKIDYLFTFGELAKMYARGALATGMEKRNIFPSESIEEIMKKIITILKNPNIIILVKGSRSMKMEKIVDLLKEKFKQQRI